MLLCIQCSAIVFNVVHTQASVYSHLCYKLWTLHRDFLGGSPSQFSPVLGMGPSETYKRSDQRIQGHHRRKPFTENQPHLTVYP